MASGLRQAVIRVIILSKTEYFWGRVEYQPLLSLLSRESGVNPYSINRSSGACGLFQFFPCSKLNCELSDIRCQVDKGLIYVRDRYGTPTNANNFQLTHGYY